MPEVAVTPLDVYNPTPTVRVDEQARPRMSELIIDMDVTETDGGLSSLALRLSNVASVEGGRADRAFEDEREIRLGSRIVLYAGSVTEPQEIFRGTVTAFEAEFPEHAPPEIVVLAEDALQAFRMHRRTVAFNEVSVADLVTTISDANGLRAIVDGLDGPSGHWMQFNESDLAFLRRVLRRFDADLQVAGDELQVSARGGVQRNRLELALHSQLRQARFTADLAEQTTAVTVTGWNATRGERISGRAAGRSPGPGVGRTGARLLEDAIGPRSEHIGHIAVTTADEADALAAAVYDQRARRFVRVDGRAEGNPRLRVGSHVQLTGTSPRFDNTYYVTEARHHFDVENGYETYFTGECHALGEPS